MSEFLAVVTTIGQQKIAAAIGGVALAPTVIRVGDGNGAPITPVEGMTDLVRRVGVAYPIISAGRDPANANAWRFEALIPEADGPFDIREIGLFDAAGDMLAIAKHPYVEKRSTAQGALMSLVTQIIVPVSETAQITLNIQADAGVSIFQQLRAGFMVVESATVANPPANPVLGASYVVPAAPTGAWAGLTGRIVQWNGNVWVSVLPPVGHVVVVQDQAVDAPARWQRREAGGWVSAFASASAAGVTLLATKAKVAGRTDNVSAVTPLGLAGIVGAGIDFRTVINASTSAPPANPALFDAYLIAAAPAPTGAWAGHAGKIATWDGTEWIIEQLRIGARVIDRATPVTSPNRELRQLAALTWTPVAASTTDWGHARRATDAEVSAAANVDAYVTPQGVGDNLSRLPFHAEILTGDNTIMLAHAGGTLTVSGATLRWRGWRDYDLTGLAPADRQFATVGSKTYHLRWHAPGIGAATPAAAWPLGRLVLADLADVAYNPGSLAQGDAAFDGTYDSVLLARVTTNAANVATLVPLRNNPFLTGSVAVNPWKPNGFYDYSWSINWARTPTLSIRSMSPPGGMYDSDYAIVPGGSRETATLHVSSWPHEGGTSHPGATINLRA